MYHICKPVQYTTKTACKMYWQESLKTVTMIHVESRRGTKYQITSMK